MTDTKEEESAILCVNDVLTVFVHLNADKYMSEAKDITLAFVNLIAGEPGDL